MRTTRTKWKRRGGEYCTDERGGLGANASNTEVKKGGEKQITFQHRQSLCCKSLSGEMVEGKQEYQPRPVAWRVNAACEWRKGWGGWKGREKKKHRTDHTTCSSCLPLSLSHYYSLQIRVRYRANRLRVSIAHDVCHMREAGVAAHLEQSQVCRH